MDRLAKKVALVTGAGQGIGRGIARRFAREGARVLVADWHAEKGERTPGGLAALGGEGRFVRTDVGDQGQVQLAVQAALPTSSSPYSNQKGSETGCGQVLALLGRPEDILGKGDVPRQPSVTVTGREPRDEPTRTGSGRTFDSMDYLREGSTREPESWVYRDRPGLPYTFTGAELKVAFDSQCRFAEGGTVAEELDRAARALVTRPDLVPTRGADGRLVPLAAMSAAAAGAGGGVLDLLFAPRTDFPLAAEAKLVMRAPKGEARPVPTPQGSSTTVAA